MTWVGHHCVHCMYVCLYTHRTGVIFDRKVQTCIFDTDKVQGGGGRRLSSEQDGTTLSALSTAASVADKDAKTTACMPSAELAHKLELLEQNYAVKAQELKNEITGLKAATQTQLTELRVANKAETRDLKNEITEMKAANKADKKEMMAANKAETQELKAEIVELKVLLHQLLTTGKT